MSNPGTPPLPRPEALKKLAQLRIERLKKEEEEEQWISGEELYTEGSSDEDDMAVRAKRKANEKGCKKSSKCSGNKPKKLIKDEKMKTPNSLNPPQIPLPSSSPKDSAIQKLEVETDKDEKDVAGVQIEKESGSIPDAAVSSCTPLVPEDEEVETEISWRPKRDATKEVVTPIYDAENAYKSIVERVNKLKDFLSNESNITSWINESSVNGYFENISQNSSDSLKTKQDKCRNLIEENSDVESALRNITILDNLLEVVATKQKEAREQTINVEQKINDELCHLSCYNNDGNTSNELMENTSSFLQLFSVTKESDLSKGIPPSI